MFGLHHPHLQRRDVFAPDHAAQYKSIAIVEPPNLGNYNIEKGVTKLKQAAPGDTYADCVGIVGDAVNQLICAIYSDRTFFIWDIKSLGKVSVKRSFLNHSAPIYDLQMLPLQSSEEVTFFATASADKTIRIWHFCDDIGIGVGVCRFASEHGGCFEYHRDPAERLQPQPIEDPVRVG